jgi:hypothetical protein
VPTPQPATASAPIPGQPPNIIDTVDIDLNWFSPFQPVAPFGPPNTTTIRDWDYQVGENLSFATGRRALFERLRLMSRTWGTLRTIIETRKDQLMAQPYSFQVRGKPRTTNARVEEVTQFFRRPDGKRSYSSWSRLLLDDLFVIDAPCLYVGHRDRGGRPLRIDVIDGATIKPLIDDEGRIPDYPNPAYQQFTKGLPMLNFTERDLIYAPMRPTPELPIWGYSPVEHIYLEVQEAIKKTLYQLNFWTEGTLPEMIMSVPKDWTAKQIVAFQAVFDAQLAGNLKEKSRVRFVPEGMKPYDVKNASGESMHNARDDALIRLVCFAFSIPPTPFLSTMNRATAQSSADESEQEGLLPLKMWWSDEIMNRIIWEEFGYDDIEHAWQPTIEVDQLRRAQIYQIYVKSAIMTPNEIRADLGMLPQAGGDTLLVYTNNGAMTIEDAVRAGVAQADQMEANVGQTAEPEKKPATKPGANTSSEPTGKVVRLVGT